MIPALVLASASPRRAALLRQWGIPFRIMAAPLNERPGGLPPAEAVMFLARQKAKLVAERLPSGFVLGADTVVVHAGEILGKPGDAAAAGRMLKRLSGGCHSVFTGLALADAATGRCETEVGETRVWMRALESELIEAYVATGEPLDKAGAYGIQGKAALFVEKIEGCYFNVVGLPADRLYLLLSRMGIKPWFGWRDSGDAGRTADD